MLADGGNSWLAIGADCSGVAGEAIADCGLGLGGGSCHGINVGRLFACGEGKLP